MICLNYQCAATETLCEGIKNDLNINLQGNVCNHAAVTQSFFFFFLMWCQGSNSGSCGQALVPLSPIPSLTVFSTGFIASNCGFLALLLVQTHSIYHPWSTHVYVHMAAYTHKIKASERTTTACSVLPILFKMLAVMHSFDFMNNEWVRDSKLKNATFTV